MRSILFAAALVSGAVNYNAVAWAQAATITTTVAPAAVTTTPPTDECGLDKGPGTYAGPVVVKPSHADAAFFRVSRDEEKTWARVSATQPDGAVYFIVSRSGTVTVVGYDRNGAVACETTGDYRITAGGAPAAPRPAAAKKAAAPAPAPAVKAEMDAALAALRDRLDQAGWATPAQVHEAEGRGHEYANTAVAEGFRHYRREANGRFVRLPTERDNIWSLGVGPVAMSVSDTGAILAGAVALEANPPSTRWAPVLRLVVGVFDDGDKRRGVFGGDLTLLHPVRGGGSLDLGPQIGWYGVNTDDRVMDLPTVALAARYRLASWLYATGSIGGTVPLDERTDGTAVDTVPDVEFNLGVGLTAHLPG